MKVKLISHTMDIEKVISLGAKTCYSSKDMDSLLKDIDSNSDNQVNMVKKLLEWGHESPIEHASFTFMVEGISRSTAQQLTRHRIASYSQRSQRYVSESYFKYVTPERIAKSSEAKWKYESCMDMIGEYYDELIQELVTSLLKEQRPNLYERIVLDVCSANAFVIVNELEIHYNDLYNKLKKEVIEDARYILPNACSTTIVFTMNLRSLKNFFGLRMCTRSQNEIRELATLMKEECLKVSDIFKLIASPHCAQLGYCPEGDKCCGAMKTIEELKEGIENE